MPSTRELRRRIKSVKSTRQITKAMELVASAKMRKASSATVASRPYANRVWEVAQDITNQPAEQVSHPLTAKREIKNVALLVISSDRAMAGAYNTNVAKQALQLLHHHTKLDHQISVITMGSKAETILHRAGVEIAQSYPHTNTHPTTANILPISTYLTDAFLKEAFDIVYVVYTEFFSMLRQEVQVKQLLPLQPTDTDTDFMVSKAEKQAHEIGENFFIYEPGVQQVLDYILPRLVDVQLYQSVQESLASEHSARRLAMKNATDNASDMIDDLTLTYNGVRQGNITREIAEITSGAAALEN